VWAHIRTPGMIGDSSPGGSTSGWSTTTILTIVDKPERSVMIFGFANIYCQSEFLPPWNPKSNALLQALATVAF